MKLVTSLVVITAMTLCASAFAQEEETPPVEEQPASAAEETPATTPMLEVPSYMQQTTAPEPATATPAPPRPSPTPPAMPSAKAASPAPAPMKADKGKKMSVEATLKDNENRWATAHGKEGVAIVESMVAEDFTGVNSKGKIQNRRAMLAEMRKDSDSYTSAKNDKLEVRKYGDNVAVVVGTYREKGTGKDGKQFDRSYRFTDTWVERNGTWKCVAGQAMVLKEKEK